MSIVDEHGNAVAMTYSLNFNFGLGLVAGSTGEGGLETVQGLLRAMDFVRPESIEDFFKIKLNARTRAFFAAYPHKLAPGADFADNMPKLLGRKQLANLADTLARAHLTGSRAATVNEALYRAEQQLLSPNGLPRRPWYRHSIYAPGFYTGYGVKTLPGIREAIEQRNFTEAQQQIEIDAAVITKFADYLSKIF